MYSLRELKIGIFDNLDDDDLSALVCRISTQLPKISEKLACW